MMMDHHQELVRAECWRWASKGVNVKYEVRDSRRGYKAGALRVVVTAHDVVLGIYPSEDGMGLHVIKGEEVLRHIVNTNAVGDYTHTAIAVHNREQALFLQAALAA